MTKAKLITALVLTALAIVLVVQNSETVDTKLLFFTVSAPRAVLLLICMAIGFIVGLLFAWNVGRRAAGKDAKAE